MLPRAYLSCLKDSAGSIQRLIWTALQYLYSYTLLSCLRSGKGNKKQVLVLPTIIFDFGLPFQKLWNYYLINLAAMESAAWETPVADCGCRHRWWTWRVNEISNGWTSDREQGDQRRGRETQMKISRFHLNKLPLTKNKNKLPVINLINWLKH